MASEDNVSHANRVILDDNAIREVETVTGHKAIDDALAFWIDHFRTLVKSGATQDAAFDACLDGYRYQVSTLTCRYEFAVLDGLYLPGSNKNVSKKLPHLARLGG